MTLEELNQKKNETLATLVDYVPDMTANELKTYKGFIQSGDYTLGSDYDTDTDVPIGVVLVHQQTTS